MNSYGMRKRFLARMLALGMVVSLCPAVNVFAAGPATDSVDMKVADRVYGWVTEAPVNNGGGSVTVGIVPAGQSGTKSYTTEKVYDMTNEDLEGMDGIDEANVLLTRLGYEVGRSGDMSFKPGVFAELCLNAEGKVIDARRVLQSGLFFDTAEYGGDLTKIGSTVMHRGVEGTGIMTGEAGDMVASGWVLAKADGTITLGDGNMATELFIEQYNVADDVKVYQVDNDTYASTEKTFADIPVTPAKDGVIYDTASENRQFAVAVFDKDYTAYDEGTAKVVEIYYFKDAIADVSSYVGLVPSSNRIGSDLSTADQGSPKPQSAPFLTSSVPFAVVDGKMWSTGDNEALNYLFYATNSDGSYSLVRYDTGWPKSGYQYWKADERALQESGIDMDSRDINQVLLSHGHSDHYGTSFDLWEMITRAGNTATVYETYEDGVGYDKLGFEDTTGALPANEYAFRSTITNWYEMDQWLELGDGLACYPILTPGHTPGVASAVYQVTVGEGGMKDAHLTYDAETGERTITDYEEGDQIFFVYMGGYGINGLNSPSKGYLRPAFVSSLRYLQSVLPYLETTTGETADGIYNLPQHTNQFPYLEVESVREWYNEENDTDYSFLHFLREGAEEVVNFAEKRASAMLYQEYDEKYQQMVNDAGGEVPYMEIDGVDVKIDATNPDPANLYTVEESGPYKRTEGEYTIQIDEDVEIIVMHGYDPYLNKGGLEEGVLTNTASEGGSAKEDFDVSKGFLFAKDGFVTDPDAWYVQIGAHVMDDYDGNVYSDTGVNSGLEFTSGPVESFHGDGWYEIIRTEAMTKEQAEELAASLEQGAYYKVNLKKTGDIVNAENVMDTFVALEEDELVEQGGIQTLPATGGTVEAQKPFNDALRNEEGKFEDYYQVVYSGYYDISMTYDDVTDRDLRMYITENSRYSQPTVFLMVPSDTDPYQFIVDSGWKETADKNSITLFLLMPDREKTNGTATAWGSWEDETDVMTYIAKAVDVAGQRPGIQTVSYCFYMVGYGDAADYVTEYIMRNPSKMAGAFTVGSTGAGAELIETLKTTASAEEGVMISEVAVPFGVVAESESEDVNAIVEYFKDANQTVEAGTVEDGFTVYQPDPEAETRQPDSEPVAGVYYLEANVDDCMSADFAQSLFDIFNTVRRYPGYQNTELRAYEDVYTSDNYEYYTSLSATGEYTYGGDIEEPGDGNYYNREWWLYVPDSAKARMDNGEKVQVLFVFMGSNGYGDEAPQRTGWSNIADEEGFIIVSPSGHVRHQGNFGNFDRNGVDVYQYCTNWNWGDVTEIIPDDLIMIEDIHNWLFSDSKYAGSLDESRVYATGQSAGGAFAHHVAKNLPDLFAASTPSSWVDNGENADTSSDVAMVVMMGQKDTTISGALSTDNARAMFENYITRYGGLKDDAGRDSWDDFTFMQETKGGTSVCTEREGTFNKYIMKTEDGVPMFVGLEVVGLTHATVPTECEFAWDIMSHFSKDPDSKVLYYDGEIVDTPVNQELANSGSSSSGGSGGGVTTYTNTVESTTNGTVTVSPKNASKGATVTITVKPDEGYELGTLTVTDANGNKIELTKTSDTKYTFKMPASKVTIKADFVKETLVSTLPFTDVAADAWYYDAVAYVYENGMMTGTNDGTTFSPSMNLTRGMMAQVMFNIEKGTAPADGSFTDVAADAWYADAVNWAAANGIVDGYGDGKFGPEDSITREQMAVLLYNYAKFKGEDVTATSDLSAFSDGAQVSDWANAAMQWAVAEDLINGSNNALNPLGTASRAEVAQILMNYFNK